VILCEANPADPMGKCQGRFTGSEACSVPGSTCPGAGVKWEHAYSPAFTNFKLNDKWYGWHYDLACCHPACGKCGGSTCATELNNPEIPWQIQAEFCCAGTILGNDYGHIAPMCPAVSTREGGSYPPCSQPATSRPATAPPVHCTSPANIEQITCPAMASLVKNCDLVPDSTGFVTKAHSRAAMLGVGISRGVAMASNNANFDHLTMEPKAINLFYMNTIRTKYGGNSKDGANEHFRSTGIRDGSAPSRTLWNEFATAAVNGAFTLLELLKATALFDVEEMKDGARQRLASNDVNVDFPAHKVCGKTDSAIVQLNPEGKPDVEAMMKDKCWSNLYGGNIFLQEEFGSPPGRDAVLSVTEMRDLFLNATYPVGFSKRRAAALAGDPGVGAPKPVPRPVKPPAMPLVAQSVRSIAGRVLAVLSAAYAWTSPDTVHA